MHNIFLVNLFTFHTVFSWYNSFIITIYSLQLVAWKFSYSSSLPFYGNIAYHHHFLPTLSDNKWWTLTAIFDHPLSILDERTKIWPTNWLMRSTMASNVVGKCWMKRKPVDNVGVSIREAQQTKRPSFELMRTFSRVNLLDLIPITNSSVSTIGAFNSLFISKLCSCSNSYCQLDDSFFPLVTLYNF